MKKKMNVITSYKHHLLKSQQWLKSKYGEIRLIKKLLKLKKTLQKTLVLFESLFYTITGNLGVLKKFYLHSVVKCCFPLTISKRKC